MNKVIEISVREWFDKVNGNSYWSAHVFVWSSPRDRESFVFTFQYGYGNHGESVVLDTLHKHRFIPTRHIHELADAGILVISHKRNTLKRELMHDKDCKGMTKLGPSVFVG